MARKTDNRVGVAPDATRHSKSHPAKRNEPDQPDEPAGLRAALTMDDIASALRCSVPTAYRLVSEGYLTTFLIGRRRYASPRAIRECVERLEKLKAVLPAQSGGNNRTGPGKDPEATRGPGAAGA